MMGTIAILLIIALVLYFIYDMSQDSFDHEPEPEELGDAYMAVYEQEWAGEDGWWFDDYHGNAQGPFESEELAIKAYTAYRRSLLSSEDDSV
jgi:hypothetical protein